MAERVYRIVRERVVPVPVPPEAEPSLLAEGAAIAGCILAAAGILTLGAFAFGVATSAIWLVPAAEFATWEAAPGLAGMLGVKLAPEVAAAAVGAAL